ncbi:MAG: low specificity L-threonine aldolase [Pseudomonadota bacterium]
MMFASDNWALVAPEITEALTKALADGSARPAYGDDPLTARAADRFNDIFERDVTVFFVPTGGAANCLALSVMTPPYGMIVCHEAAHVEMDECSGPEFFTGGAKLLTVPGALGKLTPEGVTAALDGRPDHPPHSSPATAMTLTQATEAGTLYTQNEIEALCETAKNRGLRAHMDGARFANAIVGLNATPADITWRAGVDVLSFGGTKNGCLMAEAVIFFDKDAAADFEFRRKRAGHLVSKQSFIGAQFDVYLKNDLWLQLANRANAAARVLSAGVADLPGAKVWWPTEANEVFASFPPGVADKLRAEGAQFYPWMTPSDPSAGTMQRLIASFQTRDAEISSFLARARAIIDAG